MSRARELKVGAFVLTGFVVLGLVVFMIGDERRLFDRKVTFQAVFDDVQGLKRGSPVRMGGVDIGRVGTVGYAEDASDSRLHVKFEIVGSEAKRIRVDSVASIAGKGLLGDKMVTIKVGSPSKEAIPIGGTIPSTEAKDLAQMFDRLAVIGEKAERVVDNLEKTTGTIADDDFRSDLRSSVRSMSNVLGALDQRGGGTRSRLIHDGKESEKIARAMGNLERTTAQLDTAMGGVNDAIRRVNHGPGFAHEMIYGEGATETVAQFGRAADEVATTLQGVREGNGLAHSVIYGDEGAQQMMGNLNQISDDVRAIVAGVRAGRGTLGALLVDPSVYEDIKMLLGNVERNKVLRALVRYSIKRDEKVVPVEIKDPMPAAARAKPEGHPAQIAGP